MNINKVPIPDSTLHREINSKALVETDKRKADDYLAKRKMLTSTKNMQEEINTLKNDMQEIKELLKGLVNK